MQDIVLYVTYLMDIIVLISVVVILMLATVVLTTRVFFPYLDNDGRGCSRKVKLLWWGSLLALFIVFVIRNYYRV